jgi:NADPH:quinone reductase-like Zn-dependent oxidoreductase
VSQVATAITFLSEAYAVKAGDIVFIHTIAGGLGMVMTQLAKHLGAKVIGTTSTKEKAELAKACGADEVILYRDEDVKERVNEITGGEGVHVIYDGVGKDTYVFMLAYHLTNLSEIRFELDFEIIRRKGTIVSVGNASGPVPPFSPLKLMPKNLKLLRPA